MAENKIGVLLPQSKEFPKLGKDFMKGLRMSLASVEDVSFNIEGIGYGQDSKVVIDAIQKLSQQDEIELTTGLLGHHGLSEVCDFVTQTGERLIYSDLGATRPISLNNTTGITCNSFELYKSVYQLGLHFSEKGFSNVGVSTCYNDAGYGFVEFLAIAMEQNPSIEFVGHYITPIQPREDEATILKEFITDLKPDVLFATYNGIYALENAEYLKETDALKLGTPYYGTPFVMDEKVLKAFPNVFDGTYCVSSWMPELDNSANQKFIQEFKEKYNEAPSIFALLGYENGLLVKQELEGADALEGPRGKMTVDPETNRTSYNHYIWSLKADGNNYVKTLETELLEGSNDLEQLTIEEDPISWFNAYLCH
jgi:branched-chain amino acid transport system substrate-binding protein